VKNMAQSMQMDPPEVKYQKLLAWGFDIDSAEQISAYNRPFTPQEQADLDAADNRVEFLETLYKTRPFLTARILKLEQNIVNTPYVVERLRNLGMPDQYIDEYIIYKSMRPRSSMASMVAIPKGELPVARFFGSDNDLLIDSSWLNKIAEIHQDSLFPVVRYGAGMSKGIYTHTYSRKTDEKFCGTFYYYESGSKILIKARNILICPNKMCAAAYFLGINAVLESFKTRVYIGDVSYEPHPVENVFGFKNPKFNSWENILKDMVLGNFDFKIHYPSMYALEDRFDQVVCNNAAGKFDLVVLTSMTGLERMVTEILDPRDRRVSFGNLLAPLDQ
jgi:hypothetical protein